MANQIKSCKPCAGFADGPVAGIAIACGLFGILLGFCLLWLLCSCKIVSLTENSRFSLPRYNGSRLSRRSSRVRPGRHDTLARTSRSADYAGSYGAGRLSGKERDIKPVADTVMDKLPQPVEDMEIKRDFSMLCSRIKEHAEYYYIEENIDRHLQLDFPEDLAGAHEHVSVGRLSALLHDPVTRTAAIRCFITAVIVSRMGVNGDPDVTLLPRQAVECYNLMSGTEGGKLCAFHEPTP